MNIGKREAEPGKKGVEGAELDGCNEDTPHGIRKCNPRTLFCRGRERQQVCGRFQRVIFGCQQVKEQRKEDNCLDTKFQQTCRPRSML